MGTHHDQFCVPALRFTDDDIRGRTGADHDLITWLREVTEPFTYAQFQLCLLLAGRDGRGKAASKLTRIQHVQQRTVGRREWLPRQLRGGCCAAREVHGDEYPVEHLPSPPVWLSVLIPLPSRSSTFRLAVLTPVRLTSMPRARKRRVRLSIAATAVASQMFASLKSMTT